MVNLNFVVQLIRMDRQDFTMHLYDTYLQYVINGFYDMQFTQFKNVDVLRATPNDAMIVPLPADFEFYSKIAIETTGGLFTLSVNPNLPLRPQIACGKDVTPVLETCTCSNPTDFPVNPAGFFPYFNFRSGQYVGEMYARSGGVNPAGYFRIDEKLRQIQFYRIPKTQLYIEYVSSGKVTGSTLIPRIAVPVLRAFAKHELAHNLDKEKDTIYDKQKTVADLVIAKQTYGLITMPTLPEIIDAIASGYSPMKL